MARAPSYDFERRERQKAKDAKRAAKTEAKRQGKSGDGSDAGPAPDVVEQKDAAIAKDKIQND